MKSQFEGKATNQFGEGDALKAATSKVVGSEVVLETTVPPMAMDALAKLLADQLKSAKAKL
jgi:hypothetical protein